ncbi:MAG: histidine phosphatase family protein [bacterium]
MATEIYILRHGESLDNVAGVTFDEMSVDEEGFLDNPLSDLGRQQAQSAARWLTARGVRPDAIFSSGLARSTMTAEPLAEQCGLAIETLPELREVHVDTKTLGSLKHENNLSRTLYEIPGGKELRGVIMNVGVVVAFNSWATFGLPGFEPVAELKGRAGYCLDVFAARPERCIVAVAHNFFLGALLLELIDRNPLNYIEAAPHLGLIHNCSATCVIAHPPRFRLRYAARRTDI